MVILYDVENAKLKDNIHINLIGWSPLTSLI
jgi:hypothetical protein